AHAARGRSRDAAAPDRRAAQDALRRASPGPAGARPGSGGVVRPPPRRVHQVLATLSHGDAISNEALAIQRHLRAAGFESDLFAETTHPRMSHLARRLGEYREVSGPDTVCLFHLAVGSAARPLIFEA